MNPDRPPLDPLYAIGWSGPRAPAKPKPKRVAPGSVAHTLRQMSNQRAEEEKRWDANRARYGQSMPQYYKPKDFDPGGWERYVADHPNSPNVVAWRKEQEAATADDATTRAIESAEVEAAVPARFLQGDLF
jgi:hypothetical protein